MWAQQKQQAEAEVKEAHQQLRKGLYLGPQNPVDKAAVAAASSSSTYAAATGTSGRDGSPSLSPTRQPGRPQSAMPLQPKLRPGTALLAKTGTARLGGAGAEGADGSMRPMSTRPGMVGASSLVAKTRRPPPEKAHLSAPQVPSVLHETRGSGRANGAAGAKRASDGAGVKFEHSSVPRGVRTRLRPSDGATGVHSVGWAHGSGLSAEEEERAKAAAAEEAAQQERIRKWYQMLQLFKKNTNSIEFVYLRNANPESVRFNPYDLEVVAHADVKGLNDYYTMSSKGVTHFWDGQGEFVSLDQFEREYFVYMQLMRLSLFRQFRSWKAFKSWRRHVSSRKAKHSRDVLRSQLFILNPVFREAMLRLRKACAELADVRLHALGGEPRVYSLAELVASHEAQREVTQQVLLDFSRASGHTTLEACHKAMELMEETLLASKEKGQASSKLTAIAQNAQSVRLAVIRAAQAAEEAEFSYAISAARRSEKRRVHNFVRLLDYMVCTSLHGMLMGSVSDMVAALTPSSKQAAANGAHPAGDAGAPNGTHDKGALGSDPSQGTDDMSLATTSPAGPKWGGPVLQIHVEMSADTDELIFEPPVELFEEWLAHVQTTFVEQTKLVARLITNGKLKDYMERPLDVSGSGEVDLEGFNEIIAGDEHRSLVEEVMERMRAALERAKELKATFLGFRDLVVTNRAVTAEGMRSEVEGGYRSLEHFRRDILAYQQQLADITAIAPVQVLGVVEVHLEGMLQAFKPSPERCLREIHSLLPQLASDVYHAFIGKVHSATSRLQRTPSSVEEFAEFLEFLAQLEREKPAWDKEYDGVVAHYDLMAEFGVKVPEMQQAAYHTMDQDYMALRDAQWAADSNRDAMVARFRSDLEAQVEALNKEVVDIRLLAQHDMILDENSQPDTVLSYTGELLSKVGSQQEQAQRINKFQRLFKLEETKFPELDDCSEDVALRNTLWDSQKQWAELTEEWLMAPLAEIDLALMDDTVNRFHKAVFKMERGLVPNKVVPRLRESVNIWREFVPVVQYLRNADMKDRHWYKINDVLGRPVERGPALTLQALLDMKVVDAKENIGIISTEATQEAGLEGMLDRIHDKWKQIEFVTNPYKELKDTYILGGVDEVMVVLEDSMVMISTILSSRFVAGIRPEVERTEKMLRLFSDTLDEWLECQRQWLYLETIFSAADIQRQLPAEARAFAQVDKQFKDAMRRTKDRPNAMQAGTSPGLLEVFTRCNETLEVVQKNLEDYLETKRVSFPRFYFLSNDELLEILSQTRNVQAVQPHLQKCFDGIRSLDFGEDPKSIDIFAMVSAEGERVALGKNLKARGNVEGWLTAVENNMRNSIKALAKRGVREYPNADRRDWVLHQPAQLVIVVSNIYWCQAVERCFDQKSPEMALRQFYETNLRELGHLTTLVRGQLKSLERKVLVALITIDVHNRDIVETLVEQRCTSRGEFSWQMQLRYEYDVDAECVVIRQVNARFDYGYEYLGAQPRLVVTPMTDRCYMTLTGALHLKLGGAPAGPAGTGKTETTKDLGKALGVQCVVFNCGENLDYKFMGKFFSGLAQCGAWACFDEFNRIDIEVLSVVAQQLLAIQNALKGKLERFLFEGRVIKLMPTCGVFITMNPGYAGRTELPDNLKALFRPMAMMIPDYALVAEVMLFSEGFGDAKSLSRKMVQLYKLSSEQLSQQDHYDFGMRALKSVLVMAGALKRANPDLSEDIVLIRAMRDSNIPKFLSEDARLFNAIVSDLFPGVEIPVQDYGELQVAVQESCTDGGLQPVAPFVNKVVQLYETFNVRFGVMLVGPTGGGKTCCYQMLQAAMTRLRKAGHRDPNFQAVHTWVLNPKAVKMGELYGEYNLLTNEWHDGLASSLIRAAVLDTSADRHWVVFDGPVDAVWVENMNTVLDDNCMLCLPNGERIKLNPTTMRMLFEVQDLAVASPATVSRCGMVYVPTEDMGWRPFVRSWLARLARAHTSPDGPALVYSASTQDFIYAMFEKHVDPLLQHSRKHCKEIIPTSDINLVTSVALLFQALSAPSPQLSLQGEIDDPTKIALGYIFAFSTVWGIGGNLDASTWDKFDPFVRELYEGVSNYPPGSGSVFDFHLDATRNFTLGHWDDKVARFKYQANLPYFQILVHTVDTARYSFLLETCLSVNRPCLLTGASGVGKSAIVLDALTRMAEAKSFMPVVLNFSAQTSSLATQALIESKLEKKRKRLYGAPAGKRIILFVDDLNMPQKEQYGAQPPIELLRQLQDSGGFYDRKKLSWMEIEGLTMCAACGPPGGGRQEVTPRLLRHFTMLCVPQPSEAVMRHVFSAILGGFMDHYFTADVKTRMLKPMVDSSVEVYLRIAAELLPTPAKSHYTFNLRDVSKVFQGILNIRPGQCTDPRKSLMRLWVHENMRVFHDRLICTEDKTYLTNMLYDMLKARFDSKEDYEAFFGDSTIMFGDYMRMGTAREDRVYEEVVDHGRLQTVLESYLMDYNMERNSNLQLVFFADAVQHISRIARILRQPRGNAMLVGVGGSGKSTLTRFASFMADMQCVTIELTRNYGLNEFREDLKKLYRTCGIEGKPVAFLFADNHIVQEAFVEDINNLLNSGEITGMFASDERERMYAEIRQYCIENGLEETRDAMWRTFINRVRDNLHLVLALSPVGEAFRARCRQFPSLINCTTIDWFSAWPEEALLSVSRRFLETQELGGSHINAAIAQICVDIHTSVGTTAERFYQELRRRYYVTPKSYLDLISLYMRLLADKRQEMAVARDRLLNGLQKLEDTNVTVDKMQRDLNNLQPILAQKTVDTERLLIQVEAERRDAEAIRRNVMKEEEEVKAKQTETQALKDDAQKDLEEVLPALEAAEKALNALNKNDIVEIKTFTKPPALVLLTMEGVCTLLQEKADWETAKRVLGDASFIRRLVEFDKDFISDKVLRQLKRIIDDPVFTPDQVAKQSRAAMSMCLWVRAMDTYAKVSKIVEPKRQSLRVAQSALDAMNAALAAKQQQLAEIEAKVDGLQHQLEGTQEELKSLQFQADLSAKRLGRAEKLINALSSEAVRWRSTAQELGDRMVLLVGDVFLSAACISYTGAFTGPYRRTLVDGWMKRCRETSIPVSTNFTLQSTLATAVEVREWNIQGLPTDSLSVDNGILVTRGSRWPLMVDPQDQANRWIKAMESRNGLRSLKVSDANILRTLENCIRIGSPVLLEDVGESIDPSLEPLLQKQVFMQGTRQLLRLGDSDVDFDPNFKFYMTTKLPNPHYLPEVCIKVNLINFTVTMKGLEDQLLGDVVRKERPQLEEAKDRLVVSISNDKRQLQDLEDKVLRLLRDATGNILDDEVLINTLNNSKMTSGMIQTRVKEAEETERQINEAREVYRPVPIRGSILYFVVADLALIDPMYQYSLTYFGKLFNHCIEAAAPSDDLPTRLQNLLAYTTEFMYKMVCRGLFESHKMIFSFLIVTSIQRNSGEVAPAQWDFLLRGGREPDHIRPLPTALAHVMTPAAWLQVQCAERAVPELGVLGSALETQPKAWQRFAQSQEPDCEDVGPLASSLGLATGDGAAEGQPSLQKGDFLTLLLVKILCEDRLLSAVQRYVSHHLGSQFTESPPSTLTDIYADSTPATPIIFILSQGADPTAALSRFSDGLNRAVGDRLHIISLGQGQGPIAETTLSTSIRSGDWVCLQNCHLAKSWMPRLERLVEDLQQRYAKQVQYHGGGGFDSPSGHATPAGPRPTSAASFKPSADPLADVMDGASTPGGESERRHEFDVHPEFRLWLTSMPAPHFPVPVLQNGIKITMEPPKGMRANLLRTFTDLPEEFLDLYGSPQAAADAGLPEGASTKAQAAAWKKLVFACAFFHAALQERRKFGPLGWNIRYEFSNGDLDCALQTLRMFLLDGARTAPVQQPGGPAIPWEALTYVTGQINYGGRVTDDNDRRLLMCALGTCYGPDVLRDDYSFTRSGNYKSPPAADLASYVSYIRSLPLSDDPEVFGLNSNADITFNLQETRRLIDTVLVIQPRVASGGSSGKSPEQALLELAAGIAAEMPEPLNRDNASVTRNPFAPLASGHDNSLGTVLGQESVRFNHLLSVITRSLAELQRAVKGLAVMSAELEDMGVALTNNQVPALWARAAYPSLKPLGSWVKDFKMRMEFMAHWLYEGEPSMFWLPGFFFPQGFMTAALQNHARKTHIAIDRLTFSFKVTDVDAPATTSAAAAAVPPPDMGVYVYGLYLEGAHWDKASRSLREARPREMNSALPVIHFVPAEDHTPPEAQYQCPLYKTSVRAGVLSTTGQSTNFVLYVSLPCAPGTHPSFWVMQGVAALCALDD